MTLSATDLTLIDRWQRNFPLTARPFAVVGQSAGLDENNTIATFERLRDEAIISRVGAVVRPHTIGASTLAAMRVPADRLDEVAALVSDEPLVSHNYQREHALNLWFVVTGPNLGAVAATIERIARSTGLPVVDLPLLKAYHLDLGFPLMNCRNCTAAGVRSLDYQPDFQDRGVLAAIEDGLPLVPRPYEVAARRVDLNESEVIERLERLIAAGIITRFGCVVRHRALGYAANAMAVWDVPDDIIDTLASRIVRNPHVTLCYRRPRHLPEWPYNLFCMVHAKTRAEALATIEDLNALGELAMFNQTVLFSTRCFKQRGAMFSDRSGRLH